ncbi:hypothetical protein LLG96_13155 [bacterium]|nr:hypothetical protein [bacterium]
MREKHKSTCLLCSLGCGFIVETLYGEAVNLEYDTGDAVGEGHLCSKGNFILELLNHPNRLTEPCAGGKTISRDTAFEMIAANMKQRADGSSAGLIVSGDASIEDILTALSFGNAFLGENHIAVNFSTNDDAVYRALAGVGYTGAPAQPHDTGEADCIIAVGDPFEVGPVIAGQVLNTRYGRRGSLLAVISKKRNTAARFANLHIPGPERKTLADLLRVVAEESGVGGPEWKAVVRKERPYPQNPYIVGTAKKFIETPSAVMLLDTQDPVTAFLAAAVVSAAGDDKRLMCLTTYGNARGICDVLPEIASVEELLDEVKRGALKVLLVLGADIVGSMPGRDVAAVLEKAEYVAAGAPFDNKTTAVSDCTLPTTLWLETEGTYNGRKLRPVVDPPGGALSYGDILRRLARYMGRELPPGTPGQEWQRTGLSGETVKALLDAAEKEAPEPAVFSTVLRHGDGALTDVMEWVKLQERIAW